MQPLMENEVEEDNDKPLKWKRHGNRGTKDKEKTKKTTKMVKSYITRSVERSCCER